MNRKSRQDVPRKSYYKIIPAKIQQLLLVTDIRFLLLRFVISISNLRVSNFSTNLHTPQSPLRLLHSVFTQGEFLPLLPFLLLLPLHLIRQFQPGLFGDLQHTVDAGATLLDDPVFQDDLRLFKFHAEI